VRIRAIAAVAFILPVLLFGQQLNPHTPATPIAPRALVGPESGTHYTNSSGQSVHVPMAAPVGATAKCGDGTDSFSQHSQGTCSHHGGVALWLVR
jgi:hypothetical protein